MFNFFSIIVLLCILSGVSVYAKNETRILVLVSLDVTYPYIKSKVDGLAFEGARNPKTILLDIHSFEDIPFTDPDKLHHYYSTKAEQLKNSSPDVIAITGSPSLFSFYNNYLYPLMPDVPMVGETSRAPENLKPAAYSFIENYQKISKTIDIALKMTQPKNIYLIGDAHHKGSKAYMQLVQDYLNKITKVNIEFFNMPFGELLKLTKKLPEDSIAFYNLIFSDGLGERMVPEKALKMIADQVSFPIFAFHETMIGSGAIGGFVAKGEDVGIQLIQESMLSLDSGPFFPPRIVPAVSTVLFDGYYMDKFNIPISKLAEEAEVINLPPGLMEQYKNEITIVSIIFIIMTFMLILLFYYYRQKGKFAAELSIINEQLEHRIHVRTIKLKKANEEALQAKEIAERASLSKATFLANMSHEIRTPLNPIISLTYLALQADPPDVIRDYLYRIQSSSTLLLSIINDILDFSKIETDQFRLENVPFSLDEVVSTLHNLYSVKASEKALDFKINIAPELPRHLTGDPLRLKQVLFNLISNAIKFTKKGSVQVDLEAVELAEQTLKIKFSISDTGIGITETQMENIFQMFSQADSSTTRKYGGTGLGLAICQRLVSLMGGKINLLSKPEQGSCFSFILEFSLSQYEEMDISSLSLPYKKSLQNLKDTRVLVVDDNWTNQRVARELLTLAGCSVVTAFNGLEAVEMAKKKYFDLILMDLQMPEMDGLEATIMIRKDKKIDELPIIAMTADAMIEDRQKCLDAGMNAHISKPVDPEHLYHTLMQWIPDKKTITVLNNNPEPVMSQNEFPALKTINSEKALLRLRGNQELFLHLLTNFKKQKFDMAEKISTAILQKNNKLAKELVHNLKGESATLEAGILFSACKNLELQLLADDEEKNDIGQHTLNEVSDALDDVIHEITHLDRRIEKSIPAEDNLSDKIDNIKILQQQFQTLAQLLADNNLRAKQLAGSINFNSPQHLEQWQQLLNALSELDFETALERLTNLAKDLGIALEREVS